jgi:pyruvate ferredoxin oxidoreductase gamma subunit/2-oxoisovalerate ferredoxin oxidoreductase gamma subunit
MMEIRFHSLGGEGAVIGGKILGIAATLEDKYAQIIPAYQATRRGGIVEIHIRLSDKPIDLTSRVYQTDGVVLFNERWERNKTIFLKGLRKDGFAVVNTRKRPQDIFSDIEAKKIGSVDATRVSLDSLQKAIPNTAMLGSLAKTTNIVSLKSLEAGIRRELPKHIHEININALKRAFNETVVMKR